MENQPESFDVALIREFNKDALKFFIGNAPRKVVTTEVIEYLIDKNEGFEREWRFFIALNLGKYPKSKSALLHLAQFEDLYQDWMRQNTAQDVFNSCFDNWNEKQQKTFIPALIQKALKERNSTVLSSIALRCEDRFDSISKQMVDASIPCPELLAGLSPLKEDDPGFYERAVEVSLKPGFVAQISQEVVNRFDADTFRKYVLILARDGKLSYEQYCELDEKLREEVLLIQKDHADIAWLKRLSDCELIDGLRDKQLSAYVQEWMVSNLPKVGAAYSRSHELADEALRALMDNRDSYVFLKNYFRGRKLSEELKEYLSFSPNKALLAKLRKS